MDKEKPLFSPIFEAKSEDRDVKAERFKSSMLNLLIFRPCRKYVSSWSGEVVILRSVGGRSVNNTNDTT